MDLVLRDDREEDADRYPRANRPQTRQSMHNACAVRMNHALRGEKMDHFILEMVAATRPISFED
jgi:hypothetical protein